ncbi:MAG TPA: metalloregulator ArsR/SmtB family transcription factor [Thermoanaerobaculia bacterium]|nr:metalloregulator ArsR/SmtB family transcription factor [Thermoanaerobaculia bacterium]
MERSNGLEPRPDFLSRVAALAEVTRARLLLLLERRELAVTELCAALQLPQSTVSRHLKWLLDEGWVEARREGTSRHYVLELEGLDDAGQRLWQVVREQVQALPAAGEDAARLRAVLASRRSRSQAFFTGSAESWERVRRELFGSSAEFPALLALLDEQSVVGDLGCGTGRLCELLAPYVRRVVAVDDSAAMLEEARQRLQLLANVELRQGVLEQLPVADGELDIALLVLVLHHLSDPCDALAEAARCLKPGGKLLVVDMVPHDHREYRAKMGHLWLGFSEEQLRAWGESAGFSALQVRGLPRDRDAKGPALFSAVARRLATEKRRTARRHRPTETELRNL